MKVLFVVPHYHSPNDPNVNNTKELINCFISHNHDIDILCTDNSIIIDKPVFEIVNSCNIFTFWNRYNFIVKKYGNEVTRFADLPFSIKFYARLKCFILSIFKSKTGYYAVESLSFGKIAKILRNQYDIVISISFPFVSHLIAKFFKERKVAKVWFPILWDPFVYNMTDPFDKVGKRKKVSNKILKKADMVFQLQGIKEINASFKYKPNYFNLIEEIPLLNMFDRHCANEATDDLIRLFYIGNFYNDLRNPDDLMKFLSKLPSNYKTNFVGGGCRNVIRSRQTLFKDGCFDDLGIIDYSQIQKYYDSANILIYLSNKTGNQLPSKLFEYISMGKPILNFYYNDDDPSLYFIQKYKLSLSIKLDSYEDSEVEKVISFCFNNKNSKLCFEEATKELKEYRRDNVVEMVYKKMA